MTEPGTLAIETEIAKGIRVVRNQVLALPKLFFFFSWKLLPTSNVLTSPFIRKALKLQPGYK